MSEFRRKNSEDIRVTAAKIARDRHHPEHISNGDEAKFSGKSLYLASFTKGLPHNLENGLLTNERYFRQLVKGINTGDPNDFINTPLGPEGNAENPEWEVAAHNCDQKKVRAWESQGAGHSYDLEGPDAQSVTMPPAPRLGSKELTAEMAEVYSQALLRDVSLNAMMDADIDQSKKVKSKKSERDKVAHEIDKLNKMDWFQDKTLEEVDDCSSKRRRTNLNAQTVFRGMTQGDDVGPYVSQFLLAGSRGLDNAHDPACGYIEYGSIRIDQRVRVAKSGCDADHMTTWDEWFDVQNGINLGQDGLYEEDAYRFISTPRDLATYVHNDALYEAYLNACLLLMANKTKFDPGIPFQDDDHLDHQQGFAHFGGPHILSLVTEVATRALKAVRYQKFNIHRRMRPEVLAARLEKYNKIKGAKEELLDMYCDLQHANYYGAGSSGNLINLDGSMKDNRLLPMAFREGSPMHPSYGAGHATVAGACITILKAFFDHSTPLNLTNEEGNKAFVSKSDGCSLEVIQLEKSLTVEGELNKLASNISIARNWAGVHYFTDYIESLRMGEKIALGILEEQKITYNEIFTMTVPLFDGGSRII